MKYLSERGIATKETSPNRFSIHVEGKRHSTLEEKFESFLFTCWDFVPGPAKDDFHVAFGELDDALLAVWYFYFGGPVRVGGWDLSMHQHPNWSLGKLAYRIANAFHVTSSQFEGIAESRRTQRRRDLNALPSSDGSRLLSDSRYATALRSQFIACSSASMASHILMLRRDLEEAYVVENPLVNDKT